MAGIQRTLHPESQLAEPLAAGFERFIQKADGSIVHQIGNASGEPVSVSGGGGGIGTSTTITVGYETGSPDWSTVTGADFIADDGALSGVRLATDRVFPESYIQAGATACIADGSGGGIVVQDPAIWSAKAIPGGIRINVDTQGAGGDGLLIINLP